jgi:hypothetical protein
VKEKEFVGKKGATKKSDNYFIQQIECGRSIIVTAKNGNKTQYKSLEASIDAGFGSQRFFFTFVHVRLKIAV